MIDHKCNKCKYSVKGDDCYCESCYDEVSQTSYTEGYEAAKKEFDIND